MHHHDAVATWALATGSVSWRSSAPFPADPERYWVLFVADGQQRSRLWGSFENHGEVPDERTTTNRYFDLRPSGFLVALVDRLVVEWDIPRVWHRRAASVSNMPVLEIADRDKVPFPGFDLVRVHFQEQGECPIIVTSNGAQLCRRCRAST